MSMSGVQVLLVLPPIQHLPLTHQLHGRLPPLEGMSKDRTWNANVYGQNGMSGNEEISFPKRRHYNKTKGGSWELWSVKRALLPSIPAGVMLNFGYYLLFLFLPPNFVIKLKNSLRCLLFENVLSGMQRMQQFLLAGKEVPSGYQEENVGMEFSLGIPWDCEDHLLLKPLNGSSWVDDNELTSPEEMLILIWENNRNPNSISR